MSVGQAGREGQGAQGSGRLGRVVPVPVPVPVPIAGLALGPGEGHGQGVNGSSPNHGFSCVLLHFTLKGAVFLFPF